MCLTHSQRLTFYCLWQHSEDSGLLGCYVVSLCEWFPVFLFVMVTLEDEDVRFVRNVCNNVPNERASHPWRPESSTARLWEPQNPKLYSQQHCQVLRLYNVGYGWMKYENVAFGGWYWQRKSEVLGAKLVPVPQSPPFNPTHGVAWDWTRVFTVIPGGAQSRTWRFYKVKSPSQSIS
jgi:hypothetical protein